MNEDKTMEINESWPDTLSISRSLLTRSHSKKSVAAAEVPRLNPFFN